jgi:mono/diheme cytochrome c family protein
MAQPSVRAFRQGAAWKPPADSQLRQTVWAALIAAGMSMPVLGIGAAIIYGHRAAEAAASRAASERPLALARLLESPSLPPLDSSVAEQGRGVYMSSCLACHGASGRGVAGLGKDLVGSWFIASLSDAELETFMRVGRGADHPENTTKVPMPALGGNPAMSDDELAAVVAYMRGLQDARRMPELPEFTFAVAPPSEAEKALALAAAGGDEELAEWIASGAKLYASSCAACHGADAKGVKGNGKTLVGNPFCQSLDDEELLAFIQKGRDPGDPANTTGVGMPARGGNPALSEDDILDIIAYLRSIDTVNVQK